MTSTIIGKNIRMARNESKVSQNTLAEKLCVTQQTVSDWENGKKTPQADRLIEIAETLSTSVSRLLYDDNSPIYTIDVDCTDEIRKNIELWRQNGENDIAELAEKGLGQIHRILLTEYEMSLYKQLSNNMNGENFYEIIAPADFQMQTKMKYEFIRKLENISMKKTRIQL